MKKNEKTLKFKPVTATQSLGSEIKLILTIKIKATKI